MDAEARQPSPSPSRRPVAGGPGAASLHQRIRFDIEERILSGDWPPGHRLPFEHELMARYGCSRMTVNKVMTQLASEGLIVRRRKAGSFVTRPHSASAALEIREIRSEVEALGLAHRFEILHRSVRPASPAERARLDLAPRARLLEISCRHFAGEVPFCLEERLISLQAVPEVEHEPFDVVAPGAWLSQRVPWVTAEHKIRAAMAGAATAALLAIDPKAPCLVIERLTFTSDHVITFARLTYPGEGHELTARFTPPRVGAP
jgi:GntR family histidine utilization transcriptional repressor